MKINRTTRRIRAGWRLLVVATLAVGAALVCIAPSASAAGCSNSTGAANCTTTANLTVTAGTLTLEAPANLYWNFTATGYDQWASGSATALTGCAASGTGTTCSGGTAPKLAVLDATGSSSGWAVSEYLTSNSLPTGTVLQFNGAGGGTVGNSSASPIATSPYAATTPSTLCDYGSSCTVATAASTCAHSSLGFSTCPAYAVTLGGSSTSSQVDLFSAAASSGLGAVCFGAGSATATGCVGATSSSYFNMGIKGSTPATASATATINMVVSSGP